MITMPFDSRYPEEVERLQNFLNRTGCSRDVEWIHRDSFVGQCFKHEQVLLEHFAPLELYNNNDGDTNGYQRTIERMAAVLLEQYLETGNTVSHPFFPPGVIEGLKSTFAAMASSHHSTVWAAKISERNPLFRADLIPKNRKYRDKRLTDAYWAPSRIFELNYSRFFLNVNLALFHIRQLAEQTTLALRLFPTNIPATLPLWPSIEDLEKHLKTRPKPAPKGIPSNRWLWNASSSFLQKLSQKSPSVDPPSHSSDLISSSSYLPDISGLYSSIRAEFADIVNQLTSWSTSLDIIVPYEYLQIIRRLRVLKEQLDNLYTTEEPYPNYPFYYKEEWANRIQAPTAIVFLAQVMRPLINPEEFPLELSIALSKAQRKAEDCEEMDEKEVERNTYEENEKGKRQKKANIVTESDGVS
ncbi:MAG: hypothetical protein ACTSVZ_13265 [Promethearchaeota archaeon]